MVLAQARIPKLSFISTLSEEGTRRRRSNTSKNGCNPHINEIPTHIHENHNTNNNNQPRSSFSARVASMTTASTYLKTLRKKFDDMTNLKEETEGKPYEYQPTKDDISDEDFRRIVAELRQRGITTTLGAKQLIAEEKIKTGIQLQKLHDSINSQSTSTNITASSTSCCANRNFFEGKEGFFEQTSKRVAQSSKTPLYKRCSDDQHHSLRRVSVFEWGLENEEWLDVGELNSLEHDENSSLSSAASLMKRKKSSFSRTNRRISSDSAQRRFLVQLDYDDNSTDNTNVIQDQKHNFEREASRSRSFIITFQDDENELQNDTSSCHSNSYVRPCFAMELSPSTNNATSEQGGERRRSRKVFVDEVVVNNY